MIGGADPGIHFDTYLERGDLAGVWVVECEGAVAGLTGLLVNADEGEVEPVVVTAGLRSRGIGRRLLDHMIDEARARSIRLLSIQPVARNVEAIALFHEAGFRTLGHLDMFMHLGDDEREFNQGISVHGRDFSY
jgi:GNAT superfamily N-acetyltransferase